MSALSSDPTAVVVTKHGDIRIHTFVAAYTGNNIANATHIIESNNCLVLIDSQFLAPDAMKFRRYANDLRKPIERLYISHRHPDHWFGLATAFDDDIAIYALERTIEFIRESGEEVLQEHLEKMGELAPDKIVVPRYVVKRGTESIDGVTYVFDRVIDTEIDFLLTIRLPELGIHIVQDLIYSGTHLYLTKQFDNWITILQQMLLSDDQLFLPGHGFPAGKKELFENVEYLRAARDRFQNGATQKELKDYLIGRYPERKCPGIFEIYLPRLFDPAIPF